MTKQNTRCCANLERIAPNTRLVMTTKITPYYSLSITVLRLSDLRYCWFLLPGRSWYRHRGDQSPASFVKAVLLPAHHGEGEELREYGSNIYVTSFLACVSNKPGLKTRRSFHLAHFQIKSYMEVCWILDKDHLSSSYNSCIWNE